MTARKAGRPQQNLDVRQLLIEHARDLFVVQSYDKVSTRLIADRAGVNIAMIRYYFGSKAGLFEAMLRETLRPMQLQMQRLVEESSHENFLDLMRTYYKEMVKVPKFPRLIAQVMNMPPSEVQRELLEKVFLDVAKPAQDVIFEKLVEQGILRTEHGSKIVSSFVYKLDGVSIHCSAPSA